MTYTSEDHPGERLRECGATEEEIEFLRGLVAETTLDPGLQRRAEAAVGLALFIAVYRNRKTVNVEDIDLMKF